MNNAATDLLFEKERREKEAYTIDGSLIADAINVVNDYRASVGLEPVSDLPKGIPGDVSHCIFAKAFNFDCVVHPHGHLDRAEGDQFGGTIEFNRYEGDKAEALGKILGTEVMFDEYSYMVEIPEYIARIARAFDKGYLNEYNELV